MPSVGPGCIGCERCVAVCPADAITMEDGIAVVDSDKCIGCEQCVTVCPASVIFMKGGEPVAAVASAAARRSGGPGGRARGRSGPVPEVWVFCEHTDNRPANVSWELLGKGKELAQALEGRVCSVVLGQDTEALAKEAFAYGADRVYLIDDPVLAHYRTQPYLHGMVSLVEKYRPRS